RRRQIRRVIRGFGVDVVAARRLDRDDDIAAAYRRNGESAAIEPAVAKERIALGRAPAPIDRLLRIERQRGEECRIITAREALLRFTRAAGIGRPGLKARDQRIAVFGNILDAVAGRLQAAQRLDDRGGRVEADAIADTPIAM